MLKHLRILSMSAGLIFLVSLPLSAQITLTVPDTSATPGDIVQLPIYTTSLSGLGVGQFDLDLVWDDSALIQCSSYSRVGTIIENMSLFMVTCRYLPGRVVCTTMNLGPVALSGEGALIKFIFNVSPTAIGSTNMWIENPRFGSQNVTTVGGVFTVATLRLTLTPQNPPINIPAGGGFFDFNAQVNNTTQNPISFDAWTDVMLPNGTMLGRPLLIRRGLNLAAGAMIYREGIRQSVPGNAPPGRYTYIGNVGYYPDSVITMDSFTFEKLAGDGASNHHQGWACSGWFYDKEASPVQHSSFSIHNSYPNPFKASTVLGFELRVASFVRLAVYDIAGREVVSIVNGHLSSGHYSLLLNASDLPSGVYFAWLVSDGVQQTRKLLLVK